MIEIYNLTKQIYANFQGFGGHFLLFWISLLILILWNHKTNKKINYFLILYSALLMFLFFCPITAKIIMDYCVGRDVYWRMLWLLPYVAVIGYVATNIIFEMTTKKKKAIAFIGILLLIISSGTNIYSLISIDPTSGAAKIPNYVEAMCEEVMQTAEEQGIEEYRLVAPDNFTPFVRQYDASIQMPYGRNVPKAKSHPIHDILNAEVLDAKALGDAFIEYNCTYLVLPTDDTKATLLETAGFERISQIAGYDLYYYNES